MKKLISLIFLLSVFLLKANADSSYLSALEFEYLYKDHEVIWGAKERGIEKESFLDFMFSDENSLGEKVALISALSAYFEFAYLHNDRDENEVSYLEAYREEFKTQLMNRCKVDSSKDKNILPEYRLLCLLLDEFDSTNYYLLPKVSEYIELVDSELSNSLTAQSVKVITFGYEIIYGHRKTPTIVAMYRNQFHEPYKENWTKYDQDIRPEVSNEVLGWRQFVEEPDWLVD